MAPSHLPAHIGTIRQLEIIVAVFDHGSVKNAAEALFLTQPTVSMQLKKLADSVGMPLYDIIGRKILFTEAGKEVVFASRDILRSFSQLDMNLSNLKGLKSGTLNLAVVSTSEYFIPHLLGPFCDQYPNIDVQMHVGNRQQIIERLKNGSDDFYVFSHPPENTDTDHIEFLANPLVAIANEAHPLASKKSLSLTDIIHENFIIREPGSGTRHAIERFLKKTHAQLNIRMTIESNEAIKHAVLSGLGISIISAHTLVYGASAGLVRLPIDELPINTHWYFVWNKIKRQSIVAHEFLKHVESVGRKMMIKELERNGFKMTEA